MMTENVRINLVTEERLDHQVNREEHNYLGRFFNKNGKIYVKYQEQNTEECTLTTILKLDDQEMYVTRDGCNKNQMHFVANASTATKYTTPYGDYIMELDTKRYTPVLSSDSLEIVLEYQVLLNGADAGLRKLHFTIKSN